LSIQGADIVEEDEQQMQIELSPDLKKGDPEEKSQSRRELHRLAGY
jgi:hypothetical protein